LNPSTPLDVALVGTTSAQSPNCDPALDLAAAGVAAKLSTYERERTPEALAALPRKPDARLSLFRVQPLTSAGLRVVMAETGTRRAQYAVQLACHAFTDGDGVEHKAVDHGGIQPLGKLSLASDEWLDHLADHYGHKAVTELASVILQRAEAGAAAVAPFGLPLGLMLAR